MPGTDNLFEVTLSGALNGQFVQNVLHVQAAPTTGTPDPFLMAASIAASVIVEWMPSYLDCLPEGYEFSSCRCRGVTPMPSATATAFIDTGDSSGARAGMASTYVEGPLLIFPVTFTRPALGKIFLPGVSEEDIDYGVMVLDLRAALVALVGVLLTPQTTSGTIPVDYTFCIRKGDGTDWKVPAGGALSPTIGTQRRRAKPLF